MRNGAVDARPLAVGTKPRNGIVARGLRRQALKVVISTAGRFHLFALARELERRGCLERIYPGSSGARSRASRVARQGDDVPVVSHPVYGARTIPCRAAACLRALARNDVLRRPGRLCRKAPSRLRRLHRP